MYADLLPESTLRDVVDLAVRLVEFAGALVIFAGAAWAFVQFVGYGAGRLRSRGEPAAAAFGFNRIRLTLGRFLALGLEFQSPETSCGQPSRPPSPRSASWPRSPRSGPR